MLSAVLLVVGACGGSGGGEARPTPTPCPSFGPVADESLIPKDIPIELLGDVISTRVKKDFLVVDSLSETQIIELDPQIQRDLLDNGYQIVSHDNEGFEAEIFFARGMAVTGAFSLHEYPCRTGIVRVKLVYGSKKDAKG